MYLNDLIPFNPTLAIIQIGHCADSDAFLNEIIKAAQLCSIRIRKFVFSSDVSSREILDQIIILNHDEQIHAITVQIPIISNQGVHANDILNAIDPDKDVDGLSAAQLARLSNGDYLRSDGCQFITHIPCVAAACLLLLRETGPISSGLHCVVVGRGQHVGIPIANLMMWSVCATTTTCHGWTRSLEKEVSRADVLITATGEANLVKGEWIRPGSVVIDCGMGTTDNAKKFCGDVDFEKAVNRARWITPVPGGVGPVTVALLMRNTLNAAKRCHKLTTHPPLMEPTNVLLV